MSCTRSMSRVSSTPSPWSNSSSGAHARRCARPRAGRARRVRRRCPSPWPRSQLRPRARGPRLRAARRGRSAAASRAAGPPRRARVCPQAAARRARARARGGRPPSAAGRRRASPSARSSAASSSTGPTSVGSEAALPPTATAWSGRGTSAAANAASARGAHRVELRARRRVARGSAAASKPEPTANERSHVTPPGHRADRDLGRAAAHVDDRDRARRRRARASAWRRRTRAGPRRRPTARRPRRRRARAARRPARRGWRPARIAAVATTRTCAAPAASAAARCARDDLGDRGDLLARGSPPSASIRRPMRVNARCWSTSASRPCAASATSSRVVFDPMSMQAQRMDVRGRLP